MKNVFATTFTKKEFTKVDYLTELLKCRKWLTENNQSTEEVDKVIEKTRNELLAQEQ